MKSKCQSSFIDFFIECYASNAGMFSGGMRGGEMAGRRAKREYMKRVYRSILYQEDITLPALDKVELSLSLLHLTTFQETEVSSPQQMIGIVHDDLVSCGVEPTEIKCS